MKRLLALLICCTLMQTTTLFNFSKNSELKHWKIIDDVVMGGRSNGNFKLNEEGHGEFFGHISIKNNGGFSSVRYNFENLPSGTFSKFILNVKGDGKPYQFRVKEKSYDRHSYIQQFNTTGQWQTIEIPFKDMYASFRGYRLDIPNFQGKHIEEIAFLIANKKEESFRLLIDKIELE